MKMKTTPMGIASMIEMLVQEALTGGLLKDFEPDPSVVTLTIAADPMVPGGWAVAATGRGLANVGAEDQWLRSGDTGISSKAIFAAMTGRGGLVRDGDNWPHDPSDFGRCFRLLERFPEWRSQMEKVKAMFPFWAPLVNEWPALEALYREEIKNKDGMAPRLYARLQTLGDACRMASAMRDA